jgi:serine/threonine-protein kinase
MAVAMRHINDAVPPPSAINASVPPELDHIVAQATSKDPSTRYQDTAEMHGALTAALVPTNTSTAVLPAMSSTETEGTVWPIPGSRWDPESLGRKVLLVFGFLGLVALVLLFWRLSTNDTTPAAAEGNQQTRSESAGSAPGPANSPLDQGVIGMYFEDVQAVLLKAGYETEVEYVQEGGEEGVVVGTEPPPGTTLEDGQTITLFVSDGVDEDDDSDEEGSDPKGKAKGHDKKEKDD